MDLVLQPETQMQRTAAFSPCRRYRYTLHRIWDAGRKFAAFVCLNPSTASETVDDPTVRRCIRYSQQWGWGGFVMLNLFAFRATDPSVMKAAADPVGAENDAWISRIAAEAGIVVAAWGCDGGHMQRAAAVLPMLPGDRLHCLKLTQGGWPGHPLYLKKDLKPVKWDGRILQEGTEKTEAENIVKRKTYDPN